MCALRVIKMKCGLIAYAQVTQLKWRVASGYRDVTLLPTSFTVNNQEATPWYCSHNCDCVCGQAKSETENCLETQCPASGSHSWGGPACCFPFGTFQPIAGGLMTSPSPGLQITSKDETARPVQVVQAQVCECVCWEEEILWGKKEQSWFRVY